MCSPLHKADIDLGSLGWVRAAFGTGKQQQLRGKEETKPRRFRVWVISNESFRCLCNFNEKHCQFSLASAK